MKVDPIDYSKLGLKVQDYLIDTCVAFGLRHGSSIFQRLSDAVRFIMAQKGITVTNFIDDFIGCDTKSHADTAFDTLHSLLVELGFTLSKKKLVPPTTKCICLGVEIDTENFTISIPEEKLKGTNLLCQKWRHMTTCTKRELQSVLGSLLHVSKCVPNSRFS